MAKLTKKQKALAGKVESTKLYGLTEALVVHWLWGWVTRLRKQGAVMHPELSGYARDANLFGFLRTRNEWAPPMGERTPHPLFLTLGSHRGFQPLPSAGAARGTGWMERWAEAALGRQMLFSPGMMRALHEAAVAALEQERVLVRTAGTYGDSLALEPGALVLRTDLAMLSNGGGQRRVVVPADEAQPLVGMPCLDAVSEVYARAEPMPAAGAARLAAPHWMIWRRCMAGS